MLLAVDHDPLHLGASLSADILLAIAREAHVIPSLEAMFHPSRTLWGITRIALLFNAPDIVDDAPPTPER